MFRRHMKAGSASSGRVHFWSVLFLIGSLAWVGSIGCDKSGAAPELSAREAGKDWFVISRFGAVGDGKTINTGFIQKAINVCYRAGGGTVVIPKGTFVTGSIYLKSGVQLLVEKDGVLKGADDPVEYPWMATRIAGLEMKWPAALINADGLKNVKLSGEGTIDGSGERWWREYWKAREAEPDGMDPHFKVPRPRLIHLIRCERVTVQDLHLKNPAFWNLQLTYCDGVVVSNITVRAHNPPLRAASSDGIDIDSTRNVLITRCDIESDDDAICLKAGRDADGLRVNRPTENVVVEHCRVGPAAGMVVIGSETSGGIRNVVIRNCRAEPGCGEVVRFKTRMGRGGVVEDVLYEDIEADGARAVFNFNMDAFSTMWVPEEFRTPVPEDKGTPVFRKIQVRNLRVVNAASAGRLTGLPQSPLSGLTLENVTIEADAGFTVRHVSNLSFKNVTLNGKLMSTPDESSQQRVQQGQ